MKLLNCTYCHDILALTYDKRTCRCGKSSGKYLADGLYAVYSGEAQVLGISNRAYLLQLEHKGAVELFLINPQASDCHIQKVDEVKDDVRKDDSVRSDTAPKGR